MNALAELVDALGLANAWTYLALFLAASLFMIWRLEALLAHGLEGTALGTLVMPYCSGLGNLLFVAIVVGSDAPGVVVLTNCVVNNVTNLTLLLGLPAVVWGLHLRGKLAPGKRGSARGRARLDTAHELTRLSLLLTLAAVVFFSGVTWALAEDGALDRSDGLVLVGLFLFWQCFQVFDVMKHNVRERRAFGVAFYFDVGLVFVGAYLLYVSIDWLVAWLSARPSGFISAANLGWLSGWLMVLPNALLAFYYAAKQRSDIVYASQIGDGHICIPLCVGLAALSQPMVVPGFLQTSLVVVAVTTALHLLCVTLLGGLPRWSGWALIAGYGWFVAAGLAG